MPNIAVFESDTWLADILVKAMADAGYTPTWFEYPPANTADAVALLAPALITMDIVMRDMDGFQAALLLKQDPRTKNIPLVFYSNLGTRENIERGISLGAKRYFIKSLVPPEQFVREALTFLRPDR